MRLDGLHHHLTMITADAPRCVDFYGDVLGLRLVKKTVNFDAPDVYHLYFREPEGVLSEIATLSPGFAVDEDPEHLGEELKLPPQYEANRARLEELLTPLPTRRRSGDDRAR